MAADIRDFAAGGNSLARFAATAPDSPCAGNALSPEFDDSSMKKMRQKMCDRRS